MIYCTWLAPPSLFNESNAINDCNIMLYVMTERWPAARKYRDVFERLKNGVADVSSSTLTSISPSRNFNVQDSRAAGLSLIDDEIRNLNQGFTGVAREDYSQMIAQMAGDKKAASNIQMQENKMTNTMMTFGGGEAIRLGAAQNEAAVPNMTFGAGTGVVATPVGEFQYTGVSIEGIELDESLSREWEVDPTVTDGIDHSFGYWGTGDHLQEH